MYHSGLQSSNRVLGYIESYNIERYMYIGSMKGCFAQQSDLRLPRQAAQVPVSMLPDVVEAPRADGITQETEVSNTSGG